MLIPRSELYLSVAAHRRRRDDFLVFPAGGILSPRGPAAVDAGRQGRKPRRKTGKSKESLKIISGIVGLGLLAGGGGIADDASSPTEDTKEIIFGLLAPGEDCEDANRRHHHVT